MDKKYWGSLKLDELEKAMNSAPDKVSDNGYGKEFKIDAVVFSDGNITISVYNKETKERFSIGKLMPSKY